MLEWVALILVAWALYLIECLAWIGRDAYACFRHPLAGTWRTAAGSRLPGNDRGGLVLVNPFSTSGALVTSSPWPCSLDADGITNISADGSTSGVEPRYWRFDEITTIGVQLGELRINGEQFARVPSQPLGEYLSDLILRVRRGGRGNRAAKIRTAMAASLDGDAVATAWASFRQRTRLLAALCQAHLIVAFVVTPLALLTVGPHASWPYLLAAVMLLAVTIAATYFRQHKALYPSSRSDRWVHSVSMVLLPVAAMRCVDRLSRDALCAYSPFAVAPALCGAETSRSTLRAAWVDLLRSSDEPPATPAEHCAERFRDLVAKETLSALARSGVDVLVPPVADELMVYYCPRCHAQFGEGALDHCSECAGVRLLRFAPSAPLLPE